MRPDFSNIEPKNIKKNNPSFSGRDDARNVSTNDTNEFDWLTAEQIPVKSVYGKDDLGGMEHLNYAAGLPPYLRGPYATMYVQKPWTIRQYAGFSTAEE